MATKRQWLAFEPIAGDDGVYVDSTANKMTNDIWGATLVWIDGAGTTDIGVAGAFMVPKDFVGTDSIGVVAIVNATSGNLRWGLSTKSVAAAETADFSAFETLVASGNIAAPTTAWHQKEYKISVSATNAPAVDDVVWWHVVRELSNAGDDITAPVGIVGAFFEYDDA